MPGFDAIGGLPIGGLPAAAGGVVAQPFPFSRCQRKRPKKSVLRKKRRLFIDVLATVCTLPTGPGTGTNDSSNGGTVPWGSPGNITAEDAVYATASLQIVTNTSQWLLAKNFGFAIPAGSTILGIKVEWKRAAQSSSSDIKDNAIRIIKNGTIGATDKSLPGNWPTSNTYATYGGSSDLWGLTWTDDINNAGFGAALSAIATGTDTAQVDYCRITVCYIGASPAFVFPEPLFKWRKRRRPPKRRKPPIHAGIVQSSQTIVVPFLFDHKRRRFRTRYFKRLKHQPHSGIIQASVQPPPLPFAFPKPLLTYRRRRKPSKRGKFPRVMWVVTPGGFLPKGACADLLTVTERLHATLLAKERLSASALAQEVLSAKLAIVPTC